MANDRRKDKERMVRLNMFLEPGTLPLSGEELTRLNNNVRLKDWGPLVKNDNRTPSADEPPLSGEGRSSRREKGPEFYLDREEEHPLKTVIREYSSALGLTLLLPALTGAAIGYFAGLDVPPLEYLTPLSTIETYLLMEERDPGSGSGLAALYAGTEGLLIGGAAYLSAALALTRKERRSREE